MANPPYQSFPSKLTHPFLFFAMELDDNPRLNRGRIWLYDFYKGMIHKWVATSGVGAKQGRGDWSLQRGGVCPQNDNLNPKLPWFKVVPQIYIGSIVKEGFLMIPGSMTTNDKVIRSEIMIHADNNDDGTLGCIALHSQEWEHFKSTLIHCCGHLDDVRLAVGYTWQ